MQVTSLTATPLTYDNLPKKFPSVKWIPEGTQGWKCAGLFVKLNGIRETIQQMSNPLPDVVLATPFEKEQQAPVILTVDFSAIGTNKPIVIKSGTASARQAEKKKKMEDESKAKAEADTPIKLLDETQFAKYKMLSEPVQTHFQAKYGKLIFENPGRSLEQTGAQLGAKKRLGERIKRDNVILTFNNIQELNIKRTIYWDEKSRSYALAVTAKKVQAHLSFSILAMCELADVRNLPRKLTTEEEEKEFNGDIWHKQLATMNNDQKHAFFLKIFPNQEDAYMSPTEFGLAYKRNWEGDCVCSIECLFDHRAYINRDEIPAALVKDAIEAAKKIGNSSSSQHAQTR